MSSRFDPLSEALDRMVQIIKRYTNVIDLIKIIDKKIYVPMISDHTHTYTQG